MSVYIHPSIHEYIHKSILPHIHTSIHPYIHTCSLTVSGVCVLCLQQGTRGTGGCATARCRPWPACARESSPGEDWGPLPGWPSRSSWATRRTRASAQPWHSWRYRKTRINLGGGIQRGGGVYFEYSVSVLRVENRYWREVTSRENAEKFFF